MVTALERELDVQAAILRRLETPVTETRGSSWELSTGGVDQVQQTGAPCPPPLITWFSPAPGAQQPRSVYNQSLLIKLGTQTDQMFCKSTSWLEVHFGEGNAAEVEVAEKFYLLPPPFAFPPAFLTQPG